MQGNRAPAAADLLRASPGAQVQQQPGSPLHCRKPACQGQLQWAKAGGWPPRRDEPGSLGVLPTSCAIHREARSWMSRKENLHKEILEIALPLVPATQGQIFLTVSGWVIPLRAAAWIKWQYLTHKSQGLFSYCIHWRALSLLFRIKHGFEAAWTSAGEFQWHILIEEICQHALTADHNREAKLSATLAVPRALAPNCWIESKGNNYIKGEKTLPFLQTDLASVSVKKKRWISKCKHCTINFYHFMCNSPFGMRSTETPLSKCTGHFYWSSTSKKYNLNYLHQSCSKLSML